MQFQKINQSKTAPFNPVPDSWQKKRWLSWNRPYSYRDVVGKHLPLALVTGIPLLLSHLIPLKLIPLMPCTFLRITAYPCPFCGFTRSFWAISAGDWPFAIYNFPASGFLYLLFVLMFAWHAAGLIGGIILIRGSALRFKRHQSQLLIGAVTVLFLLNWAYRISMGLK